MRPPNYAEAQKRGLLATDKEQAIHTFSNGTEGHGWMEDQCCVCAYWPPEGPAGEYCALECAMMLGQVSPELVQLFGFKQRETKYGPRSGWDMSSQTCGFFKEKPDSDDGEWTPPPPPPDPNQLVLLADPTEDAVTIQNAPVQVEVPA